MIARNRRGGGSKSRLRDTEFLKDLYWNASSRLLYSGINSPFGLGFGWFWTQLRLDRLGVDNFSCTIVHEVDAYTLNMHPLHLTIYKNARKMIIQDREIQDYPINSNKIGSRHRCDQNFSVGSCSTFKFSKSCI
ncbi:hypothetical protein CR513_15936, partial [Mucuna pruriens]